MHNEQYLNNLVNKYNNPAFIDENGLGCIFGPLVACAVMLPIQFSDDRVKDSKKIKHEDIYSLAPYLSTMVTYSFGVVNSEEILKIRNTFKANRLAMVRAVQGLPKKPDALFIDGKYTLPESGVESYAVIKGDDKIFGISVASILGKNFRDQLVMREYGFKYQKYDIKNCKGYRSPKHLIAIRKYGVTEEHRTWMPQIQRVLNGDYDNVIHKKYEHYWRSV